jgi:23S rRNA (adenine2503-C2)-methyltransferase
MVSGLLENVSMATGVLRDGGSPLAEALAQWGQPAYRPKQVRAWVLQRRAVRFDQMSDLPKTLHEQLARAFVPLESSAIHAQQADDGTEKLLLEMGDGAHVECVLLREDDRRTACVSTQVGCAMGCAFCASGLGGLERDLAAHEIVEQLVQLTGRLTDDERLTHVVVMGMGEPLANLDNLLAAMEVVTSPDGLGVSARHITISTVGLIAGIERLAACGVPYSLAISLHAPNDAIRRQIVRTAGADSVARLVEAGRAYQAATGRQVTYEYVLLGGVNDRPTHARELAEVLGRGPFVNLIPYNPVEELPWQAPSPSDVVAFAETLRRCGVSAGTRKRKGRGIDAACGQLRRRVGSVDREKGTRGATTTTRRRDR